MDMVSLLKQFVEIESPTSDKAAVDRVGKLVAEQAEALDAQIEIVSVDQAGDHVVARWGAGNGTILILCHMDTVFPLGTLAKMPFREAEGKLFGPGVLDMKAGIVISLAAIAKAQSKAGIKRPVTLLCTSDEETGSQTSDALIKKLAQDSELVLVMESGLLDGSLKTWRKGVGEFLIKVKGRAAHAGGAHAEGRNAIEELAHQVIAIQKMTDYEKGITLSVGVISGGTVLNVVPEESVARVDVRVMKPGEWERLLAEMQALKPILEGTSLEISGDLNRPPMPFDELAKSTFGKAKLIAADIGIELKAGGSGGGSDANFVAQLGIPVLDGLGAYGDGYHSAREFIFTDSLSERSNLLAALITTW
ncbi:MAG: M20 family metallopeptidase [Anaerolineae bacterium]|nr:M20 family metallopeptidase [Anaerolineae bacterium]